MKGKQVRIALLQDKARNSQEEAVAITLEKIREAAGQGANIICTQELFLTEYFCRTQDPSFFDLAQTIPGPVTRCFAEAAKQYGVVLILSLFEKRAPGLAHNTAVILDADGTIAGIYAIINMISQYLLQSQSFS